MKPDPARPTFDIVMRMCGKSEDEYSDWLTDIAVDIARKHIGDKDSQEQARTALYKTGSYWVWVRRVVCNSSLVWLSEVDRLSAHNLRSDQYWVWYDTLVRDLLTLYRPNSIILSEFQKTLKTLSKNDVPASN